MTRVAVVGAGFMGAGIAQVAATAGHDVVLHDLDPDALRRAHEATVWSLDKLVARGRLDRAAADAVLGRIDGTERLEDCAGAEVVVEAVVEDLATKQEVLARLEDVCGDDTLLTTNTSALPIGRVAEPLRRPERVVGTHFFAPAVLMELCEVVRGPRTSDEAVARARAFAESCGKTCVVVERDTAGFVATRLAVVLALEAIRLVESGAATAADVDTACRLGLGHAMGPLETADLSGLDVLRRAAASIHEATGAEAFEAPELLRRMVEAGDLGRATGRGFHVHDA